MYRQPVSWFRIVVLFLLLLGHVQFVFAQSDKWRWNVSSVIRPGEDVPWAPFLWVGGRMGHKYHDKLAMMIPVRIEGYPWYFNFQFDVGADITLIYGKNAKSLEKKFPGINLKTPVLLFGDFKAARPGARFYPDNYGNRIKRLDSVVDVKGADLGTIGANMFRDKILIIDYPNQRFSIVDEIPAKYKTTMIPCTLDDHGRILLPMQYKGQTYKVMFDNGSSFFQLITSSDNIDKFSREQPTTHMRISSWGKMHKVWGRPMNDEFILAGQKYAHITVYENPGGMSSSEGYDAITGNALFLDKILIVDFLNRQIGVKTP